jgi:hypothetical protein
MAEAAVEAEAAALATPMAVLAVQAGLLLYLHLHLEEQCLPTAVAVGFVLNHQTNLVVLVVLLLCKH